MKPRILIIDDSLTVRMNLAEAFAEGGFDTVLCATASEAWDVLARESFSLIVLDVLLPDANGIDVLRALKSAPATAEIPVMLLSTETEVSDRIRGLETGADEYVGKPYDTTYVVARARELARVDPSAPRGSASAMVLVIDDSATYREALRSALESAGYAVRVAATGEEGLRAAAASRPRAIIVDGMLPGIDGATVIRRLRLDAALRRTPCLLLTASEDHREELRALDAGADAFVHKEADTASVLLRLAAVLRSAGATEQEPTTSLLGPKKILAVDDSLTYLNALSEELRREGYDVAQARSGEEAIELLAVQPVDCILLDLIMPGLSGHETCRRIKATPSLRDIPLVMLTSMEERESMIEGINAGADDYFTKSSDFMVLEARLRAQIRRKQFHEENRLIREQLASKEIEAVEARAARHLSDARASSLAELQSRNRLLEEAMRSESEAHETLKTTQSALVQSEKLASLGQMVAGIAHEINNPLAFVINNLAVLQRDISGVREVLTLYQETDAMVVRDAPELHERIHAAEQRIDLGYVLPNLADMLARSREGLRRIERIVVNLRSFARIDGSEWYEVNLNEGFVSTVEMLRWRAGTKNVVIDTELGALPCVWCHPAKINQLAMNLLANAIDACGESGKVTLCTRCEGTSVCIEVGDDGCGIEPILQARIFDPFYTTKAPGEGTGLGLSIAYGIVKEHRGTIEVDSAPGRGSRFTVRLPIDARSG